MSLILLGITQEVFLLGGFLLIFLAVLKMRREKEPVVYVIAGIFFVILAALIKDPPSGTELIALTLTGEEIGLLIAGIGLAAFLARAVAWAVAKTDVYGKFIKALDSIVTLTTLDASLTDMKNDYEIVHKKELSKLRK